MSFLIPDGIHMKSLKLVSSSKGVPQIGEQIPIGLIFDNWMRFLLPKCDEVGEPSRTMMCYWVNENWITPYEISTTLCFCLTQSKQYISGPNR